MRPTAYPELIDSQAWSIREDAERPRVEFAENLMSVPLGGTQADRFVRLHECAHVAWTPRNKRPATVAGRLGVPEFILQCSEDARMALMLRRAARPYGRRHQMTRGHRLIAEALDRGGLSRARLETLAASVIAHAKGGAPDTLAQVASALVASHWTGDRQAIMEAVQRVYLEQYDKLLAHERENIDYVIRRGNAIANDAVVENLGRYDRHRRSAPPFKATERLATALAKALKLAPPTSWAKRGLRLNAAGDGLESTGDVHDEAIQKGARTESAYDNERAEWGIMKRTKLSLTQPLRGAVAAKRCASLAGVIPRRIDRWFSDKKVFDRRRRSVGGTVLLDASGSMSLEHSQVAALAAQSPNMTVAMYSGSQATGILTTIADAGRCATESAITSARDTAGYSNIVDGPALRWLGKQTAPRIWVSDADVFGQNDNTSPKLRQEVAQICSRSGIIRVPTVNAAVSAYGLLRRSRGRITPGNVAALNKLTNSGNL